MESEIRHDSHNKRSRQLPARYQRHRTRVSDTIPCVIWARCSCCHPRARAIDTCSPLSGWPWQRPPQQMAHRARLQTFSRPSAARKSRSNSTLASTTKARCQCAPCRACRMAESPRTGGMLNHAMLAFRRDAGVPGWLHEHRHGANRGTGLNKLTRMNTVCCVLWSLTMGAKSLLAGVREWAA